MIRLAHEHGGEIPIPKDVVVADEFSKDAKAHVRAVDKVQDGELILDIGPLTAAKYAAMIDSVDQGIGKLMTTIKELGAEENTLIILYSDNGGLGKVTDNTPLRGSKGMVYEGGIRVPLSMRWPGVIKAGSVSNEVVHHMDMMPTFLAAAGDTDLKSRLRKGYSNKAMGRDYKVHLDGYSVLNHLKDPQKVPSARKEVFYFSDTGDLTALRYGNWKMVFLEQKTKGGLRVWIDPWVPLRVPLITNLRRDPYERAQYTSNTYYDWMIDRIFLLVPAQAYVGEFLSTFKDYPPRQKAASFSLEQVMEKLSSPGER